MTTVIHEYVTLDSSFDVFTFDSIFWIFTERDSRATIRVRRFAAFRASTLHHRDLYALTLFHIFLFALQDRED